LTFLMKKRVNNPICAMMINKPEEIASLVTSIMTTLRPAKNIMIISKISRINIKTKACLTNKFYYHQNLLSSYNNQIIKNQIKLLICSINPIKLKRKFKKFIYQVQFNWKVLLKIYTPENFKPLIYIKISHL